MGKLSGNQTARRAPPADRLAGTIENKVPKTVYLCQVNEQVSCGACGGLYNVADLSQPALETMLSERRLLSAFFKETENRVGRCVEVADFPRASRAAAVLREFARLKITWPYRRENAPGACNYFFENGEYPRPPLQRAGENIPPSPYEDILTELDSGFSSKQELYEAEARLEDLFRSLSEVIIRYPGYFMQDSG